MFRACVFGAGAIGCHVAYCLHKAGVHVCLVARGDTYESLVAHGLRITIAGGGEKTVRGIEVLHSDQILPNRGTADGGQAGGLEPVDYLVLTVKTYSLGSSVVERCATLVGPQTVVLPPTTALPFWWFYRAGGEYEGRQLESLDPGGRLWRAFPPSQCLGLVRSELLQ
jgi:2-dehydropantoate 2-reductase|eukprot:COSAG01_NODE_325_length_18790_cov_64.371101_14_plen_168_part_00